MAKITGRKHCISFCGRWRPITDFRPVTWAGNGILYIAGDCDACHRKKQRRDYHALGAEAKRQRSERSRQAHERARRAKGIPPRKLKKDLAVTPSPLPPRAAPPTPIDTLASTSAVTSYCKWCREEFRYMPTRHTRVGKAGGKVATRDVCNKCRNDPARVARIKRGGTPDLLNTFDKQRQAIIRHKNNYIRGPVLLEPNDGHARRTVFELSADNECEHGRLRGDRLDGNAPNWPYVHPCGCWEGEEHPPMVG